jgi:hypothetical protein
MASKLEVFITFECLLSPPPILPLHSFMLRHLYISFSTLLCHLEGRIWLSSPVDLRLGYYLDYALKQYLTVHQ